MNMLSGDSEWQSWAFQANQPKFIGQEYTYYFVYCSIEAE